MLNKTADSLFYADDGLLDSNKSDNPSNILDNINRESGIKSHEEGPKRRWIKQALLGGKWLTDLKLLTAPPHHAAGCGPTPQVVSIYIIIHYFGHIYNLFYRILLIS